MSKTKRTKTRKLVVAKRSGVVPDLSAGAEELSIYVGNSAALDQARDAFARADAWARGDETVYSKPARKGR